MIYNLWSSDKYAEFTPATEADEVIWDVGVRVHDHLPDLNEWKPVTLTENRGEGPRLRKPKKLPDCDGCYISHRANEALADIWEKHAVLYPVMVQEAPDPRYYKVIVKTVLDCLDHERSEFARRANGVPYLLMRWVFNESTVGNNEIFRFLDNYPKSSMGTVIYVSEKFKERVVKAGLKGFCLTTFFGDPKPFVS